jgi:hydroxylamine reductase
MDEVYFNPTEEEYLNFKEKVGVLSEENEDIRSLKQLIIYGIKGMAAYTQHALMLGFEDDEIYQTNRRCFVLC